MKKDIKISSKRKISTSLYKNRHSVLAISLLVVSITAVSVWLVRSNITDNVSKQAQVANLSARPGTYVTIQSSIGSMDGITGLDQCRSQQNIGDDTGCQLDEGDDSVHFKAAPKVRKDNVDYAFKRWDGCTTTNDTGLTCVIAIKKGENLVIKAVYAKQTKLSEDKPYVQLTVAGVASNDVPYYGFSLRTASGESTAPTTMQVKVGGLAMNDCVITDTVTLDDLNFTTQKVTYVPAASQSIVLADGHHSIIITCKTPTGSVTSSVYGRVIDNQPKLCKGYTFADSSPSASTVDELKDGIVGEWQGCVTTPWTPAYWVTVTFRNDGTYSATSHENLDGVDTQPMYYGGQQTKPNDVYSITNIHNGIGLGNFVIVFDGSNTTTQDDMTDIKLMGDRLSFSFKHFNQYGPLTYQLKRQ